LFIHRFGQGFFKTFWPVVQVLLMLFALFDMIFFTSDDISALFKWSLVIIIGMTAYIVATIIVKQTKKTAFIPTMFLMSVVSALEVSLVLTAGYVKFIILMLVPEIIANTYQILKLHKETAVDPEHQERIEARRKARREAKEKQAAEKRVK